MEIVKKVPVIKKVGLVILIFMVSNVTILAQEPAVKIPRFILFKTDGKAFSDQSIPKNGTALFVFFDVTCSHCMHAIESLNRNIEAFGRTAVYLVTLDSRQNVELFIKINAPGLLRKKNVSLLYDLNNEFIWDFRPRKYPGVFLYSAAKKLMLYDDDDQSLAKFMVIIKNLNFY